MRDNFNIPRCSRTHRAGEREHLIWFPLLFNQAIHLFGATSAFVFIISRLGKWMICLHTSLCQCSLSLSLSCSAMSVCLIAGRKQIIMMMTNLVFCDIFKRSFRSRSSINSSNILIILIFSFPSALYSLSKISHFIRGKCHSAKQWLILTTKYMAIETKIDT